MTFQSRKSKNYIFLRTVSSLLFAFCVALPLTGFAKETNENDIRPPFLKADETVDKVYDGTIYTVQGSLEYDHNGERRKRRILRKIYFTDGKSNVLNVLDLYSKSKIPNSINVINSKKYFVVSRPCLVNREVKYEFLIMDRKGKKQFDTLNDGAMLLISDKNDRFIHNDYYNGEMKIFGAKGRLLKKQKYSTWTEKSYPEEEAPIFFQQTISKGDRFICFTRSKNSSKKMFYEMVFMDTHGKIMFKKIVDDWLGSVLCISENEKKIIVLEHKILSSKPYFSSWRYTAFNLKGEALWNVEASDFRLEEKLEKDRYLKDIKNNKLLDIKTGNVTY